MSSRSPGSTDDSWRARLDAAAGAWLSRMTDPGHDAEHVRRVARLAGILGEADGGDPDILHAAALLHDLGRVDAAPGRSHVDRSVEIAREIMETSGFPESKRDAVLHCILAHSFSLGVEPTTIEARILRDADRLDALGAIGIARAFSHGSEFYDPADPLGRGKPAPEGARYCAEHFREKLFQLPAGLFTAEARRIAVERVAFMHRFLERLEREATGQA